MTHILNKTNIKYYLENEPKQFRIFDPGYCQPNEEQEIRKKLGIPAFDYYPSQTEGAPVSYFRNLKLYNSISDEIPEYLMNSPYVALSCSAGLKERSFPEEIFILATFLKAEFGFFGVRVNTFTQIPFFCGFCSKAAFFDLNIFFFRIHCLQSLFIVVIIFTIKFLIFR